MKNILILNDKHHLNMGGTEKYTKNLIKILLENNCKVFEINFFPLFKSPILKEKNYEHINHNIKFNQKNPFSFLWNSFKFNKFINKTIKNKKIDTVIDNTVKSTPYIRKKRINYIWISHFDVSKIYKEQKSLTSKIMKWIFLRPNKFIFNKIIVFSEIDKEWLLKNNKKIKSENILICPLAHKSYEEINNLNIQHKVEKAKNIIWMGRLDQKQKNINFLTKIAQKLINSNIYIYIYGEGSDKNIIIDKPGIKYEGLFSKENVDQILKTAKLLILPSFFEGFPYVIVEALSNGVPCLVADTFINAKYLIDETRGRCIKNFDVDCWSKEIIYFNNLSIEKYKEYCENSLNFAKKYLTTSQFESFWLKIID